MFSLGNSLLLGLLLGLLFGFIIYLINVESKITKILNLLYDIRKKLN